MARAGEVMEDPVNGGRAIFRQTATETKGELLQIDFSFPPHIKLSIDHIHPLQEERFEVQRGTFGFLMDGREQIGSAGHRLTVPAGVRHKFWVIGDEPGEIRFEFRPALRAAEVFETLWALNHAGKVNPKMGGPGPLQMAVILSEYQDEFVIGQLLRSVQRVLFKVMAPVGKMLGYRARVPYPFAGQSGEHAAHA